MKQGLSALVVGLIFGTGLVISGMTSPDKVVGFLDILGAWDPDLAFVMGGALFTYAPVRLLVLKRSAPVLAPAFDEPTVRTIDASLIGGAALFGVGWGIAGFCPGPAIVSVATAAEPALVFVGCMAVGMVAHRLLIGSTAQ